MDFYRLALTDRLTLNHLLHFLLHRTAGYGFSALRLGRRLSAGFALQFFAFFSVGDVLRIHSEIFNPAYLATSFFKP